MTAHMVAFYPDRYVIESGDGTLLNKLKKVGEYIPTRRTARVAELTIISRSAAHSDNCAPPALNPTTAEESWRLRPATHNELQKGKIIKNCRKFFRIDNSIFASRSATSGPSIVSGPSCAQSASRTTPAWNNIIKFRNKPTIFKRS